MPGVNKDALKKIYLRFDTSGDGALDGHEVKAFLNKFVPGLSDREIAEYVTNVGGNDQKVDFEEFWVEYNKIDLKEVTDDKIEELFHKLDENKSGFMDLNECQVLLAGVKNHEELAAEEMEKFDVDGDGKISMNEFFALIKNRKQK